MTKAYTLDELAMRQVLAISMIYNLGRYTWTKALRSLRQGQRGSRSLMGNLLRISQPERGGSRPAPHLMPAWLTAATATPTQHWHLIFAKAASTQPSVALLCYV
jgi:hypothetical protein